MKRFWLFGGVSGFYAKGGLSDVLGGYNTETEARHAAVMAWAYSDGSGSYTLDWFHIADMERGMVIASHGSACGCLYRLPLGPIEPQADPL